MLLRRVIEHVKTQNWTAVALDFVIVVVGVFIGIQVANWNDMRAQKAQEALYLERLAQDFDLIIENLEIGLNSTRASVAAAQTLLAYINAQTDDSEQPPRNEAIAALGRLGGSSVPTGRSATFTEMVSSGDLSIIEDSALRDALFEYDLFADSNREGWRVLRESASKETRTVFSYLHSEFQLGEDELSLQVIGFNEAGFLADESVIPAIGIIGSISINENQLLRQQLARAREVRGQIDIGSDE